MGGLVSRGRGNGIGCSWRGNQERGEHLKCKLRKYLINKVIVFSRQTRKKEMGLRRGGDYEESEGEGRQWQEVGQERV